MYFHCIFWHSVQWGTVDLHPSKLLASRTQQYICSASTHRADRRYAVHARGARVLNKCTTTMGPVRTYCPNTFTVFPSTENLVVYTFGSNKCELNWYFCNYTKRQMGFCQNAAGLEKDKGISKYFSTIVTSIVSKEFSNRSVQQNSMKNFWQHVFCRMELVCTKMVTCPFLVILSERNFISQ